MKINGVDADGSVPVSILSLKNKITGVIARLSNSRQTVRSITALFSSNIASSALSAVGGLLVAHFLGPEVTGAFRAYTIPLTYLIFLHLGTWDGISRQIPYYIGKGFPDRVEALASAGETFNILVSVFVSFGFLACAAYCLAHRNFYGFFGWLSQVFCCWGIFYGSCLNSLYRTLDHFVTLARIQFCQALLTFGLVFSLPFLGFYGLCARVAVPASLLVWLSDRYRPIRTRFSFDMTNLRELISVGLPFSFWGNLETSVWSATELGLVLSLGGVSALGLFAVASVMRASVNSLPSTIYQVLTPRVVANHAKEESVRKANGRIIWVTVGLTGLMILPACVGSFLLQWFVPFFIPKYVAGIPVMKLCLWFPVVQAAFLPMNVLFAAGRPWLYGRGIIAGIVVFAAATYLLLPELGGLLAVAAGSLLGRSARTLAAYADLILLAGREA